MTSAYVLVPIPESNPSCWVQMKSDRELRYMDSVRGRDVNVLQGLELHVPVLDETEQSIMKAAIDRWCELGSRVS